MKKYIILLMVLVSVSSNMVFAQNTVKHHKTAKKHTPCNTMAAAPEYHHKYHGKGIAKHHVAKKHPHRVQETVNIDDHLNTAIVSIKDGNVYVNDSLVTTVKDPKHEDHRLIINYITPPPAPVTVIEHEKVNSYTGEKPMPMMGVLGDDYFDGGVEVDEVLPCSPADKAGLFPGDVITKINDHNINNGSDLKDVIIGYNPGDNISVTFTDYYGTKTKQIELAKKQDLSSCGCPNPYWGR